MQPEVVNNVTRMLNPLSSMPGQDEFNAVRPTSLYILLTVKKFIMLAYFDAPFIWGGGEVEFIHLTYLYTVLGTIVDGFDKKNGFVVQCLLVK